MIFLVIYEIIYIESEGIALETIQPTRAKMKGHIMAMRRTQSNIINLAFNITTEDGKAGVQLTQTVINGQTHEIGLRTLNGARKSAQINLDAGALADLRDALAEVLQGEEN